MQTRIISTLPRSGTWHTKYLLAFLYRVSAGLDLDIANVYAQVKGLSMPEAGVNCSAPQGDLLERLESIQVMHYLCPGFLSLDDRTAERARGILERIGALDHHLRVDRDLRDSSPANGGKICWIYRNPFAVFLSYARRFKDRSMLDDKKEISFTPVWPIAVDFQNEHSSDPFKHYVANLLNSNFMEAFMVMAASYHVMHERFPEHVKIVRYEDIRRDELGVMTEIFSFLEFPVHDAKFQEALALAVSLVERSKMVSYESALGHSLSGDKTYYGEEKKFHITQSPERNWQDVISPEDVVRSRELVAGFYPPIASMLDGPAASPATAT